MYMGLVSLYENKAYRIAEFYDLLLFLYALSKQRLSVLTK